MINNSTKIDEFWIDYDESRDVSCDVCLGKPGDSILVFCDGCNVAVH
jgi:hypothetical protein